MLLYLQPYASSRLFIQIYVLAYSIQIYVLAYSIQIYVLAYSIQIYVIVYSIQKYVINVLYTDIKSYGAYNIVT